MALVDHLRELALRAVHVHLLLQARGRPITISGRDFSAIYQKNGRSNWPNDGDVASHTEGKTESGWKHGGDCIRERGVTRDFFQNRQ